MMKRLAEIVLLLLLFPVLSFSQAGIAQSYIEELASTEPLSSAQMGVLAVTARGDTIARYRSEGKLVPASNAKLITTGLALKELGPDFRFRTTLSHSGSVESGTLKGDLYIVGGGDPTLASKDSIAIPKQELFSRWKKMILAAGIKKIEGRVIGDGRFFDGQGEVTSWLFEDIGTYYGTGGDGLSFYRNVQEFNVFAGTTVGAPLKISPSYPEAPWMEFRYNCTTGIKGSGDKLYMFTSALAPIAEIRGTFAVDRGPKTLECSNKFASYTCAWDFVRYLGSGNTAVTKGAAYVNDYGKICDAPASVPKGNAADILTLTSLGSTQSPALEKIAYITNHRSDNFYAEALLRILGKEKKGSADYATALEAEKDAVRRLGLSLDAVSLADGSGLSRKNMVSASFFCSFLKAMLNSPVSKEFVHSLPKPGPGRMSTAKTSIVSRIRVKSGSMDGVRCYSGYILPENGDIEGSVVFSIMVNNYTGPSWKILGQIDKLITLIASESDSQHL